MKLAHKYGLHDHPNGRSSHRQPTVTGMGIILVLAFIVYLFWHPFQMPSLFILGFFMLTMVSFLDDLFFLKHSLRLAFQIISVAMMVWQLNFQSDGFEAIALGIAAIVFGVGVLNAYNFMDGINGMLTLHCLLVLASMLYLNETLVDLEGHRISFTDSHFLLGIMVPMAIFGFFNIRNRALAFIGDVGSIGIAFIILFLMYNLLITTGNYTYLLLFSVFGADAGLTVIYKLILRENIFVPHRDFLFKKLVHLKKIPHLIVSVMYFSVQMIINLIVIFSMPKAPKLSTQLSVLFMTAISLIALYIYVQTTTAKRRA
ncbi:MAG: UDP-GlcNAc--UDP-phosphate GlcNAc-1-phosphate transferase [Bacteroidetes bacterium]|nr:UDP-GlcNAc--UDP-phosphate GlcNAc-1-phosphate transferase [Bacteroidota bacterium]